MGTIKMMFINNNFIKKLSDMIDQTQDKANKDILVQCRFLASSFPKENDRLQTLVDDLEREVKSLKDENFRLKQDAQASRNK